MLTRVRITLEPTTILLTNFYNAAKKHSSGRILTVETIANLLRLKCLFTKIEESPITFVIKPNIARFLTVIK